MQIPLISVKNQTTLKIKVVNHVRRRVRRYTAILIALVLLISLNLTVTALEPFFLSVLLRNTNETPPKLSVYDKKSDVDILFMGTSRVVGGINPQVFEEELSNTLGLKINTFNMGMSGAGIDLNYEILKNYIRADNQPKYIVYGITEIELIGRGKPYRSTQIPYYSIFQRPDDYELYSGNSFEEKANFIAGQVSPLFRDQRLFVDGLGLLFNPDNPSLKTAPSELNSKDFNSGYNPFPPDPQAQPARIESARIEYEPYLRIANPATMETVILEKFINLAKSRGIKVLLVNMPVSKIQQSWWHNDQAVKDYCQAVQNLAQKNNVPLINLYCNDESIYKQNLFLDSHHLNSDGARVFSLALAKDYFEPLFKPASDPNDLYKASYSDLSITTRQTKSYVYWGSVTVENQSHTIWPMGNRTGVRLSYHWYDSQGKLVTQDGVRSYFNSSVFPGQKQPVIFSVKAPKEPGNYILEIGLLYEGVAWFSDKGIPPLRKNITVT